MPRRPVRRVLGHGQRQAAGLHELETLVAEAAQVHGVFRVVAVPRDQLWAAHPLLAAGAEQALLLCLEVAKEGVSGAAAGDERGQRPQFFAQGRADDDGLGRGLPARPLSGR
jgi:hypothetical protein